MAESVFIKRGGYRRMDTFMLATIIYYGTVVFCRKHIQSRRQVEQMEQAGRSGRQNMAEGSERAATSAQTEMTLTDVARASLTELQLDFEDFINLRGGTPWLDDDPNSLEIKSIRLERTPAGANIIHNFSRTVAQNRAKLDAQGERFLEEGGFKERLTRVREATRVEPESPACPKCGEPMRLRSARKGPRAGGKFWGCTNYPECDGLLDVEGDEKRRQATPVESSRLASGRGEVKQ